jgi:hypothetical protein
MHRAYHLYCRRERVAGDPLMVALSLIAKEVRATPTQLHALRV